HPDLCSCSCRLFSLVFVWIVRVGCRRVFFVPAPDSRHHHGTHSTLSPAILPLHHPAESLHH
ncbi:hypothetical protein M9458_028679, partial [Cirrhinus mrigala]